MFRANQFHTPLNILKNCESNSACPLFNPSGALTISGLLNGLHCWRGPLISLYGSKNQQDDFKLQVGWDTNLKCRHWYDQLCIPIVWLKVVPNILYMRKHKPPCKFHINYLDRILYPAKKSNLFPNNLPHKHCFLTPPLQYDTQTETILAKGKRV